MPSFTSEHIGNLPKDDEEAEEILMYAAASMYSGATDTVSIALPLPHIR